MKFILVTIEMSWKITHETSQLKRLVDVSLEVKPTITVEELFAGIVDYKALMFLWKDHARKKILNFQGYDDEMLPFLFSWDNDIAPYELRYFIRDPKWGQ